VSRVSLWTKAIIPWYRSEKKCRTPEQKEREKKNARTTKQWGERKNAVPPNNGERELVGTKMPCPQTNGERETWWEEKKITGNSNGIK